MQALRELQKISQRSPRKGIKKSLGSVVRRASVQ
jgi:hypothetical protein